MQSSPTHISLMISKILFLICSQFIVLVPIQIYATRFPYETFRCHSIYGPFDEKKSLNHMKTRIVGNSDPHFSFKISSDYLLKICSGFAASNLKLFKQNPDWARVVEPNRAILSLILDELA